MSNPTVFYAWQSDRDRKSNDYVIREALRGALKDINQSMDSEEALGLDYDTKGIPGTPTITDTLFTKIRQSSIFVADLTFTGSAQNLDAPNALKKIPNANVLLELGYAASSIGWQRIICVMNEHYGKPSELLFDLQNRRFPICFCVNEYANQDVRKNAARELRGRLHRALILTLQQKHERVNRSIRQLDDVCIELIKRHAGGRGFAFTEIYGGGPFEIITDQKQAAAKMVDVGILETSMHQSKDEKFPRKEFVFYSWTPHGRLVLQELQSALGLSYDTDVS